MIERLQKISYFCAYAVATIPLWHYIRDGRILAGMVAIVLFAYVMVVLSSVQAAQPILSSEKAKITLPRWLPDRPKYHKWWMPVRRTLKWNLLLVPPKMGLALAFTEWLFENRIRSGFYIFYEVYSYVSRNVNKGTLDLYPQWETILIALCVILIFAFINCGLVASFTLALHPKPTFLKRSTGVIALYGGFSLTCLACSIFIHPLLVPYPHTLTYQGLCFDANTPFPNSLESCQNRKRIGETIHAGLLTPFDQSILLSANIMRPTSKITFNELGFYWMQPGEAWDNRPFVARQVVSGLLGLVLYAGATWVILWFVEDEKPLPSVPSPLHSQAP